MSERENIANPQLPTVKVMSSATISSVLKVLAGILLQEAESLEKVTISENRELNFHDEVKEFERGLIERALAMSDGNQLRAARLLGMKKSTLNGKIKIYNIAIKRFVHPESRVPRSTSRRHQ